MNRQNENPGLNMAEDNDILSQSTQCPLTINPLKLQIKMQLANYKPSPDKMLEGKNSLNQVSFDTFFEIK